MLDKTNNEKSGKNELPVVVIGGGPVGLAAAAHLVSRGKTPVVLEAGASIGASVLKWGHVRMFSPWKYNVDKTAREMLEAAGWRHPEPEQLPTGRELVELYLKPLSELSQIKKALRTGARVVSVTRQGFDKMKTAGREDAPFAVQLTTAEGKEETILAGAVIDASGTYDTPNPIGASGIYSNGERKTVEQIFYGIPDVTGGERARYLNKRVMVVGGGHSAANVLLDLAMLARESPATQITWVVRGHNYRKIFGGGANDQLPARGLLGSRLRELVETGRLSFVTNFKIANLESTVRGVVVSGENGQTLAPVDEIIATAGFRPNLEIARELRLDLDATVESPTALAPLIDPNLHSCGTVYPHGAEELKHPEKDFFIVGMKSYGRAPTFLLMTGYEQVRSVVAAISGDWESARQVELILPETGVCNTQFDSNPVQIRIAPASSGCGTGGCSTTRSNQPAAALT
jgi:thioredoxin reductase